MKRKMPLDDEQLHALAVETVRNKKIWELVGQAGAEVSKGERGEVEKLAQDLQHVIGERNQAVALSALLMLVASIEIESEMELLKGAKPFTDAPPASR